MKSAVSVWSQLVAAKLIHPKTYDKELIAELARALGLDPKKRFVDELTNSTLSAKDLLRALLHALEPITGMLEDLLKLYSEIDAKTADDESLLIAYEFEEGHSVDILLSHFRLEVTKLAEAVRTVIRFQVTQDSLWQFPYRHDSWEAASEPQLEEWRRTYVEDGEYKDFPRQRPTENTALDEAVRKAESIFLAVLQATHRYGATRDELHYRDSDESPFDDSEQGVLAIVHSDKWLSSSVLGLDAAIKSRSNPEQDEDIADALDQWSDRFASFSASESVLVSAVEALLALPMWGKRYALYSAWLLTQIHAAVDGRLVYVVVDGRLSFPFSGAHLATLDTVDGPLEVWTEMRSDLIGPKGAGRTKAIQPDYRFVADTKDPTNTTLLAIEAKQYAKSAKRVHAHALDDYTRGLPNAKVILAAYGPVSGYVLDSLQPEQSDRAIVVRDLRPSVPDAMEDFARQVVGALPDLRRPWLSYPLSVTLTWDHLVHDVDLHAFGAEANVHIWWENLSYRDATLNGHTVDGHPQVLQVDSVPERKLSVWVSVYDKAPISDAQPVIIIDDGRTSMEIRPAEPPRGVRTWHVLDLLPNGELDVIDTHPPLPRCESA